MTYLGTVELENWGDKFGLIRVKESEDKFNLCISVWIHQNRRQFIALASPMAEQRTMAGKRLRQTDDVSANDYPIYVGI